MDIAPLFFGKLTDVQAIYNSVSPDLSNQCFLKGLFSCIWEDTKGFNYTTLYPKDSSFIGLPVFSETTYNSGLEIWSDLPRNLQKDFAIWKSYFLCDFGTSNHDSILLAKTYCFSKVAVQQHFTAYIDEFEPGIIYTLISDQQGNDAAESDLITDILNAPAIHACQPHL